MNMNNEERRFGIHKKYGIDIKRETKKVPPKFYQLVEYNPRGQRIVHAQVYPTQYAVLVSKKKEMIRTTGKHYTSNTGCKLTIEPIY